MKWVVFASLLLSGFEVIVFFIAFMSMDACQSFNWFQYGDSWLGDALLGFQWGCKSEGTGSIFDYNEWTTKKEESMP